MSTSDLAQRVHDLAVATGLTVTVGHSPHGSGHTFAACEGITPGDRTMIEVEDATMDGALTALRSRLIRDLSNEASNADIAATAARAKLDSILGGPST